MTCIAYTKTKKELRDKMKNNEKVHIVDPSIFAPYDGDIRNHPDLRNVGGAITITNHPKRSWFARVVHKGNDTFKVE